MYTLPTAIKDFINHCRFEKNLSSKTIKSYQIDLIQLLNFLSEKKHSNEVLQITKVELREYLESLSFLKAKSIKRKVATIKVMFNYLEFEDILALNPMRKMRINIKEPKTLPRVLTIKQMEDIFKSAYEKRDRSEDKKGYSHFETIRNIVVVELLFATGARVSELSN